MEFVWLILVVMLFGETSSLDLVMDPSQISGFSDQYRSENTLGEYSFGYNEDHTSGGSFRREISDHHGNKMGSYGLRVGDGRMRVVNYVADSHGFRADVVSNEPGLRSQSPNQNLKVTKKSFLGVLIPGFRYSSRAPHVSFEFDGVLDNRHHVTDEHSQSNLPNIVGNSFADEDGGRDNLNSHGDFASQTNRGFMHLEQEKVVAGHADVTNENQHGNIEKGVSLDEVYGGESFQGGFTDQNSLTRMGGRSADGNSSGREDDINRYTYPLRGHIDENQQAHQGLANRIHDIHRGYEIGNDVVGEKLNTDFENVRSSRASSVDDPGHPFDDDVVYDDYGDAFENASQRLGDVTSKSYDKGISYGAKIAGESSAASENQEVLEKVLKTHRSAVSDDLAADNSDKIVDGFKVGNHTNIK